MSLPDVARAIRFIILRAAASLLMAGLFLRHDHHSCACRLTSGHASLLPADITGRGYRYSLGRLFSACRKARLHMISMSAVIARRIMRDDGVLGRLFAEAVLMDTLRHFISGF